MFRGSSSQRDLDLILMMSAGWAVKILFLGRPSLPLLFLVLSALVSCPLDSRYVGFEVFFSVTFSLPLHLSVVSL